MGDTQNNTGVQDPAELEKLENEFKEKTQDEIRQSVVDEYGFDEYEDGEKIDKLVNKELEHQKSLSVAIKQKRKWREEAETLKKTTPPPVNAPQVMPDVEKLLDEKFEQRELGALQVSDEVRKEIEIYRKLNGVSVREAQNSDYIKFKIQQEEQRARTESASIGGNRTGQVRRDFDSVKEEDLADMTDEEFAQFKKARGLTQK